MTAPVAFSHPTEAVTNLPRLLLRMDGIAVLASAAALIVAERPIVSFLGTSRAGVVIALGVAFIPWGITLLRQASRAPISPAFVRAVALDNWVWGIVSVLIAATNIFALSTGGRWAIVAQAIAVAFLADMQFIASRRMR